MRDLIKQCQERRIWRVLVAYPSIAFVLLQVIEFFINNYALDARYLTVGIIVGLVLLPAAFIWNWRHGEVGEQDFVKTEVATYVLSVMLALVLAVWFWQATPATPRIVSKQLPEVRTIAVMPFTNTGEDADVQYLCDGIAESLINWLATVPGVKVVSKSASFRLREQALDSAHLADLLGVDSVLNGRLETIDGQVVVSAALVDTRDDSQIWGERLVQPVEGLLLLEQSIVRALKQGLRLTVDAEQVLAGGPGGTDNSKAYQHYLHGHYLIQSTDTQVVEQGLDELRTAIRLDPGFARAYADIADALSQMIIFGAIKTEALLGEARSAAYAAVALAPDLAEAQTALATIELYLEHDWVAADAAFEKAVSLAPQSPVPYHRYADYLVVTLRFERAREMARLAITVDPLDSSSLHAVGWVEMFAGNFPEAVIAMAQWNKVHPENRWSYVKYALALALDGQCEAAMEKTDAFLELTGKQASNLQESWLAWSYKLCGENQRYADSKTLILEAGKTTPLSSGQAYLSALEGDTDLLVEQMDAIVQSGNPMIVFSRIFLIDYLGWAISDSMPTDPRYLALLEQINFPPRDP